MEKGNVCEGCGHTLDHCSCGCGCGCGHSEHSKPVKKKAKKK